MNRQEMPRFISVTFAILGPVVLALNSGLIPQPSGVYPPADYGDMGLAALLTLAGWALEGPPLARWVRRTVGQAQARQGGSMSKDKRERLAAKEYVKREVYDEIHEQWKRERTPQG